MNSLYLESDASRWVLEPTPSDTGWRTPYRRDFARLVHSPAFRRLQGKTQLFAGIESDFFRNRLTHSLEVAQVAKSIARRLNVIRPEFQAEPINEDIVEFAGLAHDLGHPPFGHNGERALDKCMLAFGGFEGNAQTIRSLRTEKKILRADAPPDARACGVSDDGRDFRAGLNLTARSLAAILKYDNAIPKTRGTDEGVVKGYYDCDRDIVDWVRMEVLPETHRDKKVYTIECQIMDLADDIAYSTYDLEDAFKAGFLSPLDLLALDEDTLAEIAKTVNGRVDSEVDDATVLQVLHTCFGYVLDGGPFSGEQVDSGTGGHEHKAWGVVSAYRNAVDVAANGFARNLLTSSMVAKAVSAVDVEYDRECPVLSRLSLEGEVRLRVETLKTVAYRAIIQSPRLKVAEHRGRQRDLAPAPGVIDTAALS